MQASGEEIIWQSSAQGDRCREIRIGHVFCSAAKPAGASGLDSTAGAMGQPNGRFLPVGKGYCGNDRKPTGRLRPQFRLGFVSTGNVASLWTS